MKRLYVFSIRSFIGPFIITFIISMFMLIMQFFWKYIDDLMGKGLEVSVILELLFYVSASLIPLALPLAMLLSSIMTFGNLAEHNELTALKASGLSLYRIIRPLFMVVILICLGTFYFANYIIPVANLKWRALIYDIQETKISKIITPGSYSTELEGYAIKVNKGENGKFKDVVIHDHNDPNIVKTVKAKGAEIYNAKNGSVLYLHLTDGQVIEELGVNQNDNFESQDRGKFYPARRSSFGSATYQIDLRGFKLNRSDEDLFKNSYEMMNVFQIDHVLDSIKKENKAVLSNFITGIKSEHLYFTEVNNPLEKTNQIGVDTIATPTDFTYASISDQDKRIVLEQTAAKIRRKTENLMGQNEFLKTVNVNMNLYKIEFHRKYALTMAIMVLFFVGAPLGAIVRKGGFGAPVVIACLLFMIYFVLTEVGEGLANSGASSPFVGMWLATFVLSPVAMLLMRSAANDSKIFNKESWVKFFKRKK